MGVPRLYWLETDQGPSMAIPTEEKSTRNEVLRFIKIRGRAGIREISGVLRITPMAVRRHVRKLQSAGLVRTERVQRGRGRPADLCLLTDLGDGFFPKAYDRFCADLIRSIVQLDGEAKVDRLFETRKDLLVRQFAERMTKKGPAARVREAVRILCEGGYMAECGAVSAQTFLITEHNCAIAHIAQRYPQACQAELCFLAQVLGAEVQRQSHALKGDSECSYLVRFPATPKMAPEKY